MNEYKEEAAAARDSTMALAREVRRVISDGHAKSGGWSSGPFDWDENLGQYLRDRFGNRVTAVVGLLRPLFPESRDVLFRGGFLANEHDCLQVAAGLERLSASLASP